MRSLAVGAFRTVYMSWGMALTLQEVSLDMYQCVHNKKTQGQNHAPTSTHEKLYFVPPTPYLQVPRVHLAYKYIHVLHFVPTVWCEREKTFSGGPAAGNEPTRVILVSKDHF